MALGCVCPVYSTARIETSPIVSDKGRGAQPSQTAFLSLSRFQSRRLEDKLRVALSPSFYQALLQVALGRWCGTRRQSGSSGQTLIHAGEAMNVPLQEERASLSQGSSCGLESKVNAGNAGSISPRQKRKPYLQAYFLHFQSHPSSPFLSFLGDLG